MRRGCHLAACVLLMAACTTTTVATTDQFQSTAPTFPRGQPTSTVTTVARSTTTTAPVASAAAERTRGVLPDGTVFDVYVEPSSNEDVTEIYAPIMVDLDEGSTGMLDTTFSDDSLSTPQWDDRTYALPAGALSVQIEISEFLTPLIGPDYRSIVEAGITATSVSGWPVLLLAPPFRWPTINDPVEMEVDYETFSVQPFCDELATACSTNHSLKVSQFAGWELERAWRIESPLSRTVLDPYFLDPGPLSPRFGHDLIWTGEEMIVWGGAHADRTPHLVEGAAFNPETNEWWMLPPSPIDEQASRAIWVGDEMLVTSQDAIVAYRPAANDWEVIGGGFSPAMIPGTTVAIDTFIYMWTPSGIVEIEVATGSWQDLPDPGFGGDQDHEGALRILDGRVHAVGLEAGPCGGRILSVWTGSGWESLPKPPLATAEYADCSLPNQTAVAGGRLIVWEDDENPTLAYEPNLGTWEEIAQFPLSGSEGRPGPISMGENILVAGSPEAAIYLPSTDQWEVVSIESPNNPSEMVWTGNELLMWGSACCHDGSERFRFQDAWRWTPPD